MSQEAFWYLPVGVSSQPAMVKMLFVKGWDGIGVLGRGSLAIVSERPANGVSKQRSWMRVEVVCLCEKSYS